MRRPLRELPTKMRRNATYPAGALIAPAVESPDGKPRILMALSHWSFEPAIYKGAAGSTHLMASGTLTCHGKVMAAGYRGIVDALLVDTNSDPPHSSMYRSARWFPGDHAAPCQTEIYVKHNRRNGDIAIPLSKTWIDLTTPSNSLDTTDIEDTDSEDT